MHHLFPYREEGDPPIPRPTLDVRLQHGDTGDWTLSALVDTGAPRTIFDRGAADALGVRIGSAGRESGTVRIMGGTYTAQFEHVDLALVADAAATWSAEVAFIKDPAFKMPFQGVLGTLGFLDKFAVTFNKYFDYFVVERPDDFHSRVGEGLVQDPIVKSERSWRRGR